MRNLPIIFNRSFDLEEEWECGQASKIASLVTAIHAEHKWMLIRSALAAFIHTSLYKVTKLQGSVSCRWVVFA